jgi:hypothetical protein
MHKRLSQKVIGLSMDGNSNFCKNELKMCFFASIEAKKNKKACLYMES